MQAIIDGLQSGEWSQKQLIAELIKFNDRTITEYDEVCDQVDLRDAEIEALKKEVKLKDKQMAEAESAAAKVLEQVKTMKADNILMKAQLKDYPAQLKENKRLEKKAARLQESSKKYQTRSESLTKDCRDYRAIIARKDSEMARLRLTGHKQMGDCSFHLFPSKVVVENSKKQHVKRVNLIAMNGEGCMKIIGVDDNGDINQPKSHDFHFNAEQSNFIKGFALVAEQDGWQFTDRVLSMIN